MSLPGYLALREILRKSEWGGDGTSKECPSCGFEEPISETEKNSNGGHDKACLLRSALDDLTDEAIGEDEKRGTALEKVWDAVRRIRFHHEQKAEDDLVVAGDELNEMARQAKIAAASQLKKEEA